MLAVSLDEPEVEQVADLRSRPRGRAATGRPERTCAGCRVSARAPTGALRPDAESTELVRFAFVPGYEPPLVPDLQGRLGGRGVWVHARKPCLDKAARGGFARSLKQSVKVQSAELLQLMQGQVERRIQGLLLAAMRRRAGGRSERMPLCSRWRLVR